MLWQLGKVLEAGPVAINYENTVAQWNRSKHTLGESAFSCKLFFARRRKSAKDETISFLYVLNMGIEPEVISLTSYKDAQAVEQQQSAPDQTYPATFRLIVL
jgi:hypothetical protein